MATEPVAYRPDALTLQWHITEACNLACSHCYQEAERHTAPLSVLLDALAQFRGLLQHYRHQAPHRRLPGHINLTGGEPFSYPDIFPLLQKIATCRDEFSFALLSNGSFLDTATVKRLAPLKPRFVQVSLEGTRETHDAIRGDGDHRRVCGAIRDLRRADIPVLLSFTAQRRNFRDFPAVAKTGRKLGVKKVWADRFIPVGGAATERQQVLTPDETHEFITRMKKARRSWQPFSRTEVSMHRALQFLLGNNRPYRCRAGGELITLMANGDLVPCRRMPITIGNLHHSPLLQLYRDTPLLHELRSPLPTDHPCQACTYATACKGGLRCLSHALTGSWQRRDPGCWRKPATTFLS